MEEFALIKSRVNLNRVNLGIALISDLKVYINHLVGVYGEKIVHFWLKAWNFAHIFSNLIGKK